MTETRFKIAAYGLCIREAHLLLARYVAVSTGQTWWTLPGGKLEHGEHPVDTVRREVEEETGYTVDITHLLGVDSRVHPVDWGIPGGADLHTVSLYYRVSVVGGELRSEVAGSTDLAAWIPLAEVGALDRAVVVDAALATGDRRPADGRVAPIHVTGRLRH